MSSVSSHSASTSSAHVAIALASSCPIVLAHPLVKFQLDETWFKQYCEEHPKPPFGFDGLGEFVYKRTYSRLMPNGRQEEWKDTIYRVVNGCYTIQKQWIQEHNLGWEEEKGQDSAKEMFERMYQMKFLPPGRGLWAMGSPITEERGLFAALNNCGFVSTKNLCQLPDPTRPFCFLMDASMLGVGVGFDVDELKTVNQRLHLHVPSHEYVSMFHSQIARCMRFMSREKEPVVELIMDYLSPQDFQQDSLFQTKQVLVEDSRDGWVHLLQEKLHSYFSNNSEAFVLPDTHLVRKAGSPIAGFGGTASGDAPLLQLMEDIDQILFPLAFHAKGLTCQAIVDIMNCIGKCVVAGNVRRTAEIVLGPAHSEDYISLKDYDKHPERKEYGWTSNNSILATVGQEYDYLLPYIVQNGEPGFAWLSNMQTYGLMNGHPDEGDVNHKKDARAQGGNPCLEQTLESYELCCLVETFPHNNRDLEDFKRTLKFAYLYAKTVTLRGTHWPETNRIMLRNHRIGCSVSGIAQFLTYRRDPVKKRSSLDVLKEWLETGVQVIRYYDNVYSDWLAVPHSIKHTSVKPSGTVSLVAGATSGLLYPESRFYIRRVRVSKNSQWPEFYKQLGYHVEESVDDLSSMIIEFIIDAGEGIRTQGEVSMWEQLLLAEFMQRYWANNQVSCTIRFKTEEAKDIPRALDHFQYKLKGISFSPEPKVSRFVQMPYEPISQKAFKKRRNQQEQARLRLNRQSSEINATRFIAHSLSKLVLKEDDHETERFCDSEQCMYIPRKHS